MLTQASESQRSVGQRFVLSYYGKGLHTATRNICHTMGPGLAFTELLIMHLIGEYILNKSLWMPRNVIQVRLFQLTETLDGQGPER